jgi:hypothetical protein
MRSLSKGVASFPKNSEQTTYPRVLPSLVPPFGITVTYLDRSQAATADRLFSILARRVARSLRVKVH